MWGFFKKKKVPTSKVVFVDKEPVEMKIYGEQIVVEDINGYKWTSRVYYPKDDGEYSHKERSGICGSREEAVADAIQNKNKLMEVV